MSVQKDARFEIRLSGLLKKDIQSFCDDNGVDMTYYFTTLVRSHLKKTGYLTPVKKAAHQWIGDINDMPMDINTSNKKWRKVI